MHVQELTSYHCLRADIAGQATHTRIAFDKVAARRRTFCIVSTQASTEGSQGLLVLEAKLRAATGGNA